MDEHAGNVRDFEAMMSAHSDWLNSVEQKAASFKYPSKLVDRVLQQIDEHKVCVFRTVGRIKMRGRYFP